jgi:hypothetical protein
VDHVVIRSTIVLRMQRTIAALLVVGVLAACSGSDESASTTTAPEVTVAPTTVPETAAPTTDAVTTSSVPPSEPTAPTTDSTTTTSEPTPTTLDPGADLAKAIQRDAMAGDDVLFEVLSDPTLPDSEDRLRAYFAGEALVIALNILEQFRTDDLTVEANPSVPRTFGLAGEPRLLEGPGNPKAEVETCRLDSDIVMAPASGSGVRVPINETITRTEAVSTFELVGGIWQLESWVSTAETVGDLPCG